LKVSESGEATFYAVREGASNTRGAEEGQGRGKREGMVSQKFEHPPA